MRINEKSGYIFHLARILSRQPLEKVKAVHVFTCSFCLGVRPPAQQKPVFVENGRNPAKSQKCVEKSRLPDLIPDVLDRPKRP